MFRNQQTISSVVQVSGNGYWSGLFATVEFRPARPNTGITFVRKDLAGQPRIPATSGFCVDIPRRTCIQNGSALVEMIEHIMSALAGLRIDNCEVWVDRAEIPAFDGSSLPVVEALQEAGVRPQGVPRPKLVVQRELVVQHDGSWIRALPGESPGCLDLRYELDYPETAIGQQNLELRISPESFVRELAPARTFLLESEAQWLRSRGLGRQVSFQDLLVFGEDGVIENRLRFEDECVRHKALDVIGDLAIAGFDIEGRIVAHKSGHQLNGQFVRRLIQEAAIAAATDGATGGQPTDTLRESA